MPEKMFDTRLLMMLAETPVHAGSGAELGGVDLPIQRERHTRYPTIHGSGVKGVLRDLSERKNGPDGITTYLFGSPPPEGPGGESLEAGTLVVSDARLLLLPVRSVGVPFAWVTCPYLLCRLQRDIGQTGAAEGKGLAEAITEATKNMDSEKGRVPQGFPDKSRAVVEELEIDIESGPATKLADALAAILPKGEELDFWRQLLKKNLIVLPDGLFGDLALHCTEVVTRVRLSEQKTVEEGALWTEEYVPADSLFYSVLGIESRWPKKKCAGGDQTGTLANGWGWVSDLIRDNPLAQFGGKQTIGRGFLRLHLWPE